jgi:DNA-binding NarL/FixJ family response regulator
MEVIYFLPSIGQQKEELESIKTVVSKIKKATSANIKISPSWSDLMLKLQNTSLTDALVVFRLDFLEREHMSLDEVLSMLSSLTRFVADKHINTAVVVNKPCQKDIIETFKRNNVLGLIPGMRFFSEEDSFAAYRELIAGNQYWPSIAIAPEPRYIRKKLGVDLTKREHEVFRLVTKMGLSNRKIADTLHISEDTVKSHVGSIMKKYGVRNRTQLALARETGIIK